MATGEAPQAQAPARPIVFLRIQKTTGQQ